MTIIEEIIEFPGGKRRRDLENDPTGIKFLKEFFKFSQEFTLDTAITELRVQQKIGFDKNPRVRTDNSFDRSPALVRPLGKIEFFSKLSVGPALIEIMEELLARSPVVTGSYKSAHRVYYNRVPVADSVNELRAFVLDRQSNKGFDEGDKIQFVNIAPYARKLEYLGVRRGTRGKFAGKNQRAGKKVRLNQKTAALLLRPNGAYQLTSVLARRRFKSISNKLKFEFISGGSSLRIPSYRGGRVSFDASSNRRGSGGRPYLYPSISIILSGRGIQ